MLFRSLMFGSCFWSSCVTLPIHVRCPARAKAGCVISTLTLRGSLSSPLGPLDRYTLLMCKASVPPSTSTSAFSLSMLLLSASSFSSINSMPSVSGSETAASVSGRKTRVWVHMKHVSEEHFPLVCFYLFQPFKTFLYILFFLTHTMKVEQ